MASKAWTITFIQIHHESKHKIRIFNIKMAHSVQKKEGENPSHFSHNKWGWEWAGSTGMEGMFNADSRSTSLLLSPMKRTHFWASVTQSWSKRWCLEHHVTHSLWPLCIRFFSPAPSASRWVSPNGTDTTYLRITHTHTVIGSHSQQPSSLLHQSRHSITVIVFDLTELNEGVLMLMLTHQEWLQIKHLNSLQYIGLSLGPSLKLTAD